MSIKRSIKKVACMALACAAVVASATTFVGCTTSHPEVEMKLSFNNNTYTLNYTLYRKVAPATVQHFLELVDGKFYDGLCVHNYTSDKLFTGGYTFDGGREDDGGLIEREYFNYLTANNLTLTQTVWADGDRTQPLNTVYGEFSNNGFAVKSGALKQSFGSLTMYYTPKDTNDMITVQRADGNGYDLKNYKENSATSLFFISMSTSNASSNDYCTFAQLDEESVEALNDLKAAITEYIEEEYDGEQSDFAPVSSVIVDGNDPYVGDAKETQDYAVPVQPIVIEAMSVKSY